MKIFANLSKIGLIMSFVVWISYEITGYISLKFVSLVIGAVSLTVLAYFATTKGKVLGNDILHYLKMLK